ncbi:MAG: TIGR03668 family PPOX class F420-dependent oxidoreductase [Candidatus Limnocylindrales bacterium]
MPGEDVLTAAERRFLDAERRAILATTAPDGRARLVPVCYVLTDRLDRIGRPVIYTPIDEKPKRTDDPHAVARVRDLFVLPEVTLIVDRWDEDWDRLAWLRMYGSGELLEPEAHERAEHAAAVEALRARYAQYETHDLDSRPIIRIGVERVVSWGEVG